MKNSLLILSLFITAVSCDSGEEGNPLPSPCEVETPKITFEYTPTKITLKWKKLASNYTYGVNYNVQSDKESFYGATQNTLSDTFATITSFHPGTTYQAIISVGEGEDAYIALNRCNGEIEAQEFTPPCSAYARLNVQDLTSNSAIISWDEAAKPDAKVFTVNLRKKGTTDITTNSSDQENVKLTGLVTKTDYQVQLASTCTDGKVYITEWFDFKTL